MTVTTGAPEVAAFAAAVRRHLDDLPADDVDDLVDGLEADLLEQAAESDGFAIPDAATYAAELRAAAGLPERAEGRAPRVALRIRVSAFGAETVRRVRANRAGAWLLDFVLALRPVWWIARGWALYALTAPAIGAVSDILGFPGPNTGGWLLLCALTVLSVQWGRGRWAGMSWVRVLRTGVSIVTAVALPFLVPAGIASVRSMVDAYESIQYVDTSQPGLTVDGERVRNIFAYDADGTPLTDVQLFDQAGRPLTTVGDSGGTTPVDDYFLYGGGPVPVALSVPGRAPIWNVYPLAELPADAPVNDTGNPDTSKATTPVFPFPFVPAVPATPADAATSTPTPGASPEPTPAVTP